MRIFTNNHGLNILSKLKNITFTTKTRWIYDKQAVRNQITNWEHYIPWIKPYYAMKSNPSVNLIQDIISHQYNVGLDAASLNEIDLAYKYVNKHNIIYTNPHTINHELEELKSKSLHIKVVDSMCEITKMVNMIEMPQILIRMNSGNPFSDTNFDTKFGATAEETVEIIDFAKKNGMGINGISFHIGSGGSYNRKDAYMNAFQNALPHLEHIQKHMNVEKPILNFGGGLMYNTDLSNVLGWTRNLPYTMIAEPGRYFSEPSHHLLTQVIAITSRGVYLDNGVYHELNCYQRDHWTFPIVTHYVENNNIHDVKIHKFTNVFGPTCDSGDKIDECFLPNNIQVGDWIILPNMGAYTNAGMIEFNGIKGASSFEAQCSNDIEQ